MVFLLFENLERASVSLLMVGAKQGKQFRYHAALNVCVSALVEWYTSLFNCTCLDFNNYMDKLITEYTYHTEKYVYICVAMLEVTVSRK